MLGYLLLRESLLVARVAVADEHAILNAHDAVGVLLGELRVVRDHDHQAVARELAQDLHHLDGGLRVERSGRLVGQDDLGVVDDGARDGHALHLTARELVGALVHLLAQPHAAQGILCAGPPLGARGAREQQRHLNIGDHALMRDQVVVLEHEPHAVVAVGIPVLIGIALGGSPVDHEVARGVVVKAADDIEQGRLAAARLSKDAHELPIAESCRYALEGAHGRIARGVVLGYVLKLEHEAPFDSFY